MLADSRCPSDGRALLSEPATGIRVEMILMRTRPDLDTPGANAIAGNHACITKPIKPAELMQALLLAADARRRIDPFDLRIEIKQWRPLHVLLVEDHPFNQRVASLITGETRPQVVIADNGETPWRRRSRAI